MLRHLVQLVAIVQNQSRMMLIKNLSLRASSDQPLLLPHTLSYIENMIIINSFQDKRPLKQLDFLLLLQRKKISLKSIKNTIKKRLFQKILEKELLDTTKSYNKKLPKLN